MFYELQRFYGYVEMDRYDYIYIYMDIILIRDIVRNDPLLVLERI